MSEIISEPKLESIVFEECPYVILLDPGHGIDTEGKESPLWNDGSQLKEWIFNRAIAKKIIDILNEKSISFKLIVPEDEDVPLRERADRANSFQEEIKKPCLYISIHGNAADSPKARGFEVFTSPRQTVSDVCATIMFRIMEAAKLFKMRACYQDGDPDKEAKFVILQKTKMAAILTENGFFTNEAECKKMLTGSFQNKIAEVHVKAIEKIIKNRILG